ncbi:MAG: hypothetical protein IKU73_00470 [Clostridia bacterium]|nr:hypothetical protein [Clostridia bacterium]
MKRKAMVLFAALLLLLGLVPAAAQGGVYDAQIAGEWMQGFADALAQLAPVNDPQRTADPARAGQYLIEYEFGTVLAAQPLPRAAQEIIEIDVRNAQVTDCRGVRVGMEAEQALGGVLPSVQAAGRKLLVLGTQESGYGWSWAYIDSAALYGVEHITYGEDALGLMKEYTLTYVIEEGVISAIRMKAVAATQAQAEEGLRTAEEIASRQTGEQRKLAAKNTAAAFGAADLQVMGGSVLGQPVDQLIACLGEPRDVQTLPSAQGRILIYDDAAVRLGLNEYTGVEVVRGVSVSGESIVGPRGLSVGFEISDAASLFRCDADMHDGGMLYEDAAGSGVLAVYDDETCALRYSCTVPEGETAQLEIGVSGGRVTYWHLYFESDLGDE